MSNLRALIPPLRVTSLCAPVPKVNGYGRPSCGMLFYEASGHHFPGRYGVNNSTLSGHTTFKFLNGGIQGTTNDQSGDVADWSNQFGTIREAGYGELILLPLSLKRAPLGYFQTVQAYDGTARPGIALIGSNGAVRIGVEADHALAGQENVELSAVGAGLTRQAQNPVTVNVAFEIQPNGFVRGWSTDGTTANQLFLGGSGISTLAGPCYAALIMQNNQNGFREHGSWGDIVFCSARAQSLRGPNGGSVRISVNGVVQTFTGPVTYLNLDGAGRVSYDPAATVWYPSIMRYEFFSAPALGGVLVADLTIPTGWGGDSIGLP